MTSWKGFTCWLASLIWLLAVCAAAETLKIEMKFKKADQVEKAQRLKSLHEHQKEQLDEELTQQMEQVAGLISNVKGKSLSFPGDVYSPSSLITATMTFGTQKFEVILDTGSTILWIASYNKLNSLTYIPYEPQTMFSIEYGTATASGYLAYEKIALGDLQVNKQIFGMVTNQEGMPFSNTEWRGLLGLGYPALAAFENVNITENMPFFDSIMKAKLLNQNAFSFYLVNTDSSPPMFFMGAPPPQYYKGTLEFSDVVDKYYWTLHLEDILVDGISLGLCNTPQRCRAVVDTGTSYMSAPKDDLPVILKALTGDSAPSACQTASNKTITYVLQDGKTLTLEPDYYFTKSSTGEYCKVKYIGLDVDPPHGPVHIFGDVLFRKYFVHFDRDHDRVGFAVAKRTIDHDTQSIQSLLIEKLRAMF